MRLGHEGSGRSPRAGRVREAWRRRVGLRAELYPPPPSLPLSTRTHPHTSPPPAAPTQEFAPVGRGWAGCRESAGVGRGERHGNRVGRDRGKWSDGTARVGGVGRVAHHDDVLVRADLDGAPVDGDGLGRAEDEGNEVRVRVDGLLGAELAPRVVAARPVGRPGPAAGAGAATPRGSVRRADPRQERAATRRMCLGARVHSIRVLQLLWKWTRAWSDLKSTSLCRYGA